MNTADMVELTAVPEFTGFPKMARLSRESIITEKIDGTNAQVFITPIAVHYRDDFQVGVFTAADQSQWAMYAGSRTRWLKSGEDNFGFWAWVKEHFEELKQLGPGKHFGEWWGRGIQRGYGLKDRRFSLFNVQRWCLHGETPQESPTADPRIIRTQEILPPCVGLVPVLLKGVMTEDGVAQCLQWLIDQGSVAAPGFMNPEGIVIYHTAANVAFKKTLGNDGAKGHG